MTVTNFELVVFILAILTAGSIGFVIGLILKGDSTVNNEEDDIDLLQCIHPTCQRRKTTQALLTDKQFDILTNHYKSYLERYYKEREPSENNKINIMA